MRLSRECFAARRIAELLGDIFQTRTAEVLISFILMHRLELRHHDHLDMPRQGILFGGTEAHRYEFVLLAGTPLPDPLEMLFWRIVYPRRCRSALERALDEEGELFGPLSINPVGKALHVPDLRGGLFLYRCASSSR